MDLCGSWEFYGLLFRANRVVWARSPLVSGMANANRQHDITMQAAEMTVPRARKEINLTPKQERNFWKKVDKSGPNDCWLWTAAKSKKGYGSFGAGKNSSSHRISWTLSNGQIPDELCVCHRCDNPPCVNPDHLFLGTNLDNVRDKISKGRARYDCGDNHHARLRPERMARGERCSNAKLTAEKVIEIRTIYAAGGTTLKKLGAQFDVHLSLISLVVQRKIWKHILP